MANKSSDPKRERSFPFCGRLIVLEARGTKPLFDKARSEEFQGFTAINFPSMPQVIELARHADYMVTTNPAFPDGIHQYKGTSVQKIPIEFELHAFEKTYCPQGVLTLLRVASTLEALIVPFSSDNTTAQVGPAAATAQGAPERTDIAQLKSADEGAALSGQLQSGEIYPPATCYLQLIVTDRSTPGIDCVGYVEDVNVRLFGPYMRGPGIAQNLPTKGVFSFTFVHHPGHGNAYNVLTPGVVTERQAYAQTIKQRLFNTRDLLTQADFASFNSLPGQGQSQ